MARIELQEAMAFNGRWMGSRATRRKPKRKQIATEGVSEFLTGAAFLTEGGMRSEGDKVTGKRADDDDEVEEDDDDDDTEEEDRCRCEEEGEEDDDEIDEGEDEEPDDENEEEEDEDEKSRLKEERKLYGRGVIEALGIKPPTRSTDVAAFLFG